MQVRTAFFAIQNCPESCSHLPPVFIYYIIKSFVYMISQTVSYSSWIPAASTSFMVSSGHMDACTSPI